MSHANNLLIVSIPTKLKLQIDEKFSHYNQTDLDKIYFIVFKINKEIDYQLHSKNHVHMLSLKNGTELKNILEGLKDLKIIKGSTVAQIGLVSNSYEILQPYNYKQVPCHVINYYDGQTKIPVWVERYASDGGVVKGKEFSNFKRDKVTDVSYLNSKIEILEKDKAQMQATIEELTSKLATLTSLNLKHDIIVDPTESTPHRAPFDVLTNENVYTHVVGDATYLISNYQKLLDLASDEYQIGITLRRIVNQTKTVDKIYTNNKGLNVRKVVEGNIITVTLN